MKKGFTLVELLAVIVILGIIAAITIPRIQDVLYGSQDDAYDLLVARLEDRASVYVSNNNLGAQVTSSTTLDVYLSDLVDEGYIDNEELSDPRVTGDHIDQYNSFVRFTLENGILKYTAYFTSESESGY